MGYFAYSNTCAFYLDYGALATNPHIAKVAMWHMHAPTFNKWVKTKKTKKNKKKSK
jgi:hypothetical protein